MITATRVVPALIAALLLGACGLAVSDEQRMERAQAALARGDLRSAFIEVQRILSSQPDNGDARLIFATALLQAGDVGRAAEEYRRAVDLGRTARPLELELLLAQGFYADLLTALDSAPANDPSTTHQGGGTRPRAHHPDAWQRGDGPRRRAVSDHALRDVG